MYIFKCCHGDRLQHAQNLAACTHPASWRALALSLNSSFQRPTWSSVLLRRLGLCTPISMLASRLLSMASGGRCPTLLAVSWPTATNVFAWTLLGALCATDASSAALPHGVFVPDTFYSAVSAYMYTPDQAGLCLLGEQSRSMYCMQDAEVATCQAPLLHRHSMHMDRIPTP